MTILKSKLDVLIAARAIIAEEGRWTQQELAKDCYGNGVAPWSKNAVCFCSMGALECVVEDTMPSVYELHKTIGGSAMTLYNDTHSHSEVLAVWDITIERLRSQDQTIRRVAEETNN